MSANLHELSDKLRKNLRRDLLDARVLLDELTIQVDAPALINVLTYLRDGAGMRFKQLTDLTAIDHPERIQRFDVVYQLLSFELNHRIRVKVRLKDGERVSSVVKVFPVANWLEREVFDLFGIEFIGHPDMRRILTDYNFEGHPLRKDFPLTGYKEVRYDFEKQAVVYDKVNLQQDFRKFDFLSPWEGMTPAKPVLPGDEKAEIEKTASRNSSEASS